MRNVPLSSRPGVADDTPCRLRPSEQSTNVSGTAWKKTPYTTVNFIWLVYPAVVFFIVTVFLFATTLRSRNVPLWKSSALALLCSTDADKEERSASEKQRMAKKMNSRVEHVGERHRLIHTTSQNS
jgi:hypothetical protein